LQNDCNAGNGLPRIVLPQGTARIQIFLTEADRATRQRQGGTTSTRFLAKGRNLIKVMPIYSHIRHLGKASRPRTPEFCRERSNRQGVTQLMRSPTGKRTHLNA